MPNTTQILPTASVDARIEALLFATGSSIKLKTLSRFLDINNEELDNGIKKLKERLSDGGTTLIEADDSISLVTSANVAKDVEGLRKNQFSKDIGEAALEVLAIIMYKERATRASIEYIRGVNCAATLRTLSMRGLIEKTSGKTGEIESSYKATDLLLAHLGVTHVSDIPDYESTLTELDSFEERAKEMDSKESSSDNVS